MRKLGTKKIYSITDIEKNYFVDWLSSTIDNDTAKNLELSKIYFLGFAEKETRIELIENHIADLEKVSHDLEKICENGKTCSSEMKNNDIFFISYK